MTPERWRQMEELYDAVKDLSPAERLVRLTLADPELRSAVEAIFAQEGSALEHPAWERHASLLHSVTVFSIGMLLGPYKIDQKIGEGGMGEVFRATDTRLARAVAIKTCRQEFGERFQREARAIASLNHRHICSLYDVGPNYLVMELLEGESLEEKLKRGRLSIEHTLLHGSEIADALAAAHAKGVVHRDVKPANIMITKAGAKVLDFGLAKCSQDEKLTGSNVVMGTPAYMAPEQREGRECDTRTDIYSLGLTLHEMATGKRCLKGEKPALAQVPERLAHVIEKCLALDPEDRWQTAADVRSELSWAAKPVPATENAIAAELPKPSVETIEKRRWQLVAGACTVIAILAFGAAWWKGGLAALVGHSRAARLNHLTFTQLTEQPGQELEPSMAPDGKSFVYESRASGNWDIYSQRVGGKNAVNLTKDSPADDTQPVFSPNGEQIAFRSEREGGGIFVMGATGENVKRITDFGYDPAWSPDGSEIVCASTIANPGTRLSSKSQLFSVNIVTGEKHSITPQTGIAMQPHWSPHGYRIAYWAQVEGRLDIWTVPAGGGAAVRVTNDVAVDWNPVWSPDGAYLYFTSNRGGTMNLWRVPVAERSGKVLGELEPVTAPSPYAAHISLSRTGRQMVYVQRTQSSNIYRVQFDSVREIAVGQPVPITQGSRSAGQAQPSPDGEWVVFIDRRKQDDLFVVRNDGSGLRQLLDDNYYHRRPVWSPDGKRVAFFSNRSGNFEIWTIRPDGGGLHQLTYARGGAITHPVWSPDGKRLIYSVQNGTPSLVEPDRPWNSQSPKALPRLSEPDTWYEAASWSPDGRKLAGFQLRADGKFTGIGIYSFETGVYTRITDFGMDPCWLKDGRRLLFSRGIPPDPVIYLVDSQSRKIHQVLSVEPNGVDVAVISADNRWIYFNQQVSEADIWLANLE